MQTENVRLIQRPLREQYKRLPVTAMVVDQACTGGPDPLDPFHSVVRPMPASGVELPVGVHHAVGGLHDAPTPGDLLCAALAACQDSTIRMVANLLGLELEFLEVNVSADVDVRGTLAMDDDIPVGFQSIRCQVRLKTKQGTPPKLVKKLQQAVKQSCVVQQTLMNPPAIQTEYLSAPNNPVDPVN